MLVYVSTCTVFILLSRYPSPIRIFFFNLNGTHRDLHSFPTRRSSDLLVNSAGIGIGGKIDELPAKHVDLQLDINLRGDRKSTRLNSSHVRISYAVFCLKKKKKRIQLLNTLKIYQC